MDCFIGISDKIRFSLISSESQSSFLPWSSSG